MYMKLIEKSFFRLFFNLILGGLFLSLGTSSVLAAGFGVSPPNLANEHLLPGSHYEQIIYLVRSEPTETLLTTIKINAPEIESWIKVEQGLEFELPKGVQQFPVKFTVDVPQNAGLNLYEGTIDILTFPESAKGQITTALGAKVKIALRVTNKESTDFTIRGLILADVEEGSPLKLILKIQNEGNQKTGPTEARLEVFDAAHQTLLKKINVNIVERVDPLKTQDLVVEFPVSLGIGQYWGDMEIYRDKELIKQASQVFFVLESALMPVSVGEKGLPYLYVGIGVIIGSGIAVSIFLRRRNAVKKILS